MVVRDQRRFKLANTALKWMREVTTTAVNAAVLPGFLQLICVDDIHSLGLFELDKDIFDFVSIKWH